MVEETPKAEEKAPEAEDKKQNLLQLMRFWLFGTFLIVTIATFAYMYIFAMGNIGQVLRNGWPMWLITLGLCVLAYFGYMFYLKRKPE